MTGRIRKGFSLICHRNPLPPRKSRIMKSYIIQVKEGRTRNRFSLLCVRRQRYSRLFKCKNRKEGERKMQIYEYRVALAGDGRNILVREKAQGYGRMEKIASPDDAVRAMRDIFRLHERAEEYVYLYMKKRPIGFLKSLTETVPGLWRVRGRYWCAPCCAAHPALSWCITIPAGD